MQCGGEVLTTNNVTMNVFRAAVNKNNVLVNESHDES